MLSKNLSVADRLRSALAAIVPTSEGAVVVPGSGLKAPRGRIEAANARLQAVNPARSAVERARRAQTLARQALERKESDSSVDVATSLSKFKEALDAARDPVTDALGRLEEELREALEDLQVAHDTARDDVGELEKVSHRGSASTKQSSEASCFQIVS